MLSLQVRGLSYFLWMMDCYPALARLVKLLDNQDDVEDGVKDWMETREVVRRGSI